jgi:hypothetical protein
VRRVICSPETFGNGGSRPRGRGTERAMLSLQGGSFGIVPYFDVLYLLFDFLPVAGALLKTARLLVSPNFLAASSFTE